MNLFNNPFVGNGEDNVRPLDQIYNDFIFRVMLDNDIPDTPETRLAALEGLREAWKEEDMPFESLPWRVALSGEINRLRLAALYPKLYFGSQRPMPDDIVADGTFRYEEEEATS